MDEFKKDPVFYGALITLYALCFYGVYVIGRAENIFYAAIGALLPWLFLMLPWSLAVAVIWTFIKEVLLPPFRSG